jgi:excisionase family DNA binding protein
MEETFYTLEEIAEKLKVSYMTVYRWVKDGKLKAVKAGKQYRVTLTELNIFLNSKQ